MTDKQAASKLKERVSDWQSYLGRSENWLNEPTPPAPAAELRVEPSPRVHEPIAAHPGPQPVPASAAAPAIEVVAAEPPAMSHDPGRTFGAVVEVLPPDEHPRYQNSPPRRVRTVRKNLSEADLKGVLFNDSRQAEAEYNHARRANMVLTSFVVLLLGVLFTVMAWIMVD